MAYWAFEPLVQHLPYGVGGYLRSQPGQQTFEGLCAVALQRLSSLVLVVAAQPEEVFTFLVPPHRRPVE
jgi:hypothetical protein